MITETLQGIIDKLNKEELVPSNIIASIHGLNNLSTFGTHPKDFEPEQVKPVLINLNVIIKWYLRYREGRTINKINTGREIHIPGEIFEKSGKGVRRYSGYLKLLQDDILEAKKAIASQDNN